MNLYKSKRSILLVLDIAAIAISFLASFAIRNRAFYERFGNTYGMNTYAPFLAYALIIYVLLFLLKKRTSIELLNVREIVFKTIEHQIVFMGAFMVMFFVLHKTSDVSRIFVGVFGVMNIILCSIERILYHFYCVKRNDREIAKLEAIKKKNAEVAEKLTDKKTRHVFIIGARSIGLYGGFESFMMNLLQQHEDNKNIQYHVTCKAAGTGYMDLDNLPRAVSINDSEFIYCNAHCVLIPVPKRLGTSQAVIYDLRSLKWVCSYIERHHIQEPIVYFLAPRIGPFEGRYVQRIHEASGLIYQNPAGIKKGKNIFTLPARRYRKYSERIAIRNADLVVCDSRLTEEYIKEEYKDYSPKTTVVAYGSYVIPSFLADNDPKYVGWLKSHNLIDGQYYVCVGNYAEENNYEAMIREFIRSNSEKDFAIVTTDNPKYDRKLQQKLEYRHDKRIKFVGTVYDQELLNKIRANAYACIYGQEFSRTDQLLLEALGTTDLNLLLDSESYKDVAGDSALYWSKEYGNLAALIDKADQLPLEERKTMGEKAKQRIRDEYSWKRICEKYEEIFLGV